MANVKAALDSMAANIESQTGKSVPTWVALLRKANLERHAAMMKWLKAEHGLTYGYANYLALQALSKGGDAPDGDQVSSQYAGPKAALRPLYDALVAAIKKLGADVEISPKKHNVSLVRKKQFALLQPSTATRLDVGLILRGVPPAGRLEASGSFNAMMTHRIRLESVADLDAQVKAWLKQAYESAG